MKEGCAIKVEGGGYGIVMSTAENAFFRGRIGRPQVAICLDCGEVSIYGADVDKLKSLFPDRGRCPCRQRPSACFDEARLAMPHSY